MIKEAFFELFLAALTIITALITLGMIITELIYHTYKTSISVWIFIPLLIALTLGLSLRKKWSFFVFIGLFLYWEISAYFQNGDYWGWGLVIPVFIGIMLYISFFKIDGNELNKE